ncbi:MAG: alpha/beta hydrolase-fold protein [Ignavibacteriales bacterium]|nr:alpha/beta hydrolase-fold protein [Ignavibacteriales bacterium]
MKTTRRTSILMAMLLACSLYAQTSHVELRSLSVPGVGSWQFNVYLPDGYDQSSQRYPVVYLFRGAVDEWMDRTEDASRGGRNIQGIADTLVAQNVMGKLILVMPGFTAMSGPASEADYSFVLNTLIPFIDQQYRTLPGRWFRGVDGFSLGGLHMVNLIWRNPERFSSAGSYDGTVSMFNFNQMIAAGEPYFARIRPIQFLLHSAAISPSNLSSNRQFEVFLNSIGIRNAFPDLLFSTTSQHNWWNADEHMIRALPLHWSKFQIPSKSISVRWSSSIPGKAAGTVRLAWSGGQAPDTLKTMVECSSDGGVSWQTLLFTAGRDSVYDWNTRAFRDGTRYLVRTQIFGDTSYGVVQSQRIIVDNPGNSPPDIVFLAPQKGETISGTYRVTWSAEDPEGDPIRASIFGSSDDGRSWQAIASDLPNTGSYSWNSQATANALSYLLKITCSDGTLSSQIVSPPVRVQNDRQSIGTAKHVAGVSDGKVTANVVNPGQLTGHVYRVVFDDSSGSQKAYSVFDVSKNSVALQKIAYVGDGTEGPSFDGLRLSVYDPPSVVNNRDSTRWTKGASTLTSLISVPTVYAGSDTIKGVAYPSDYEIRIANQVVDTSSSYLGSAATPLYFTVWNTTESHRSDVVLGELDGDGRISRFDEVYILEKNQRGQLIITWEIFFSGDDRAILPAAGSVFTLKTIKPIRSGDIYEFTALATSIQGTFADLPQSIELSQNYPNPFNPRTAVSYQLSARDFIEISVFDVLGRQVTTLVRTVQNPGTYTVCWDAAGLPSGIYFYRLKADKTILTKKALLLK